MITLRTKFRASVPRVITDGTFSMVTLNSATVNTNRYTWAGDVVSSAAQLAVATVAGSIAGLSNPQVGLYTAMGSTINAVLYTFANDSTVRYTPGVTYLSQGVCTSNPTIGLIVMGGTSVSAPGVLTRTYSYSSNTDAASGNLTSGSWRGGACSTKEVAMIALGGTANSVLSNLYTYATGTSVGATSFVAGMWDSASASNGEVGIFRKWNTTTPVLLAKYVFTSDSMATATNLLSQGNAANCASGGGDTGYFNPQNASLAVNKYAYATDAVTAGALFNTAVAGRASLANGTKGVTI